MFLPNDVIRYTTPARAVRILWIDGARTLAHVFELGQPHALPSAALLGDLEDDVRTGRACLLTDDPYAARRSPAPLPLKYREVQARAWNIVAGLQAEVPALYRAQERAVLIARCAEAHGVSRPTVLRYLRRFWERGQTPEALVPDYGNSGARGKSRGVSNGVKRGRPRKAGAPGRNVDAGTRATFGAAIARYAATHAGFSRRAAYRQMLDDFYPGREPGEVPSFGQFNYWLDKDGACATAWHG